MQSILWTHWNSKYNNLLQMKITFLTSTLNAARDEQRASFASCSSFVSGGTFNTIFIIRLLTHIYNILWRLNYKFHDWMNTWISAVFCNCWTSWTVVSRWARMESIDRFCSVAISSTCAHRVAWRALIADRFSNNWTGFPWKMFPFKQWTFKRLNEMWNTYFRWSILF